MVKRICGFGSSPKHALHDTNMTRGSLIRMHLRFRFESDVHQYQICPVSSVGPEHRSSKAGVACSSQAQGARTNRIVHKNIS